MLRHHLLVEMYHSFLCRPFQDVAGNIDDLTICSLCCIATLWGWKYYFVLEIQCHFYNYNMESKTKIKKTPAYHPLLKQNEILISRKKP